MQYPFTACLTGAGAFSPKHDLSRLACHGISEHPCRPPDIARRQPPIPALGGWSGDCDAGALCAQQRTDANGGCSGAANPNGRTGRPSHSYRVGRLVDDGLFASRMGFKTLLGETPALVLGTIPCHLALRLARVAYVTVRGPNHVDRQFFPKHALFRLARRRSIAAGCGQNEPVPGL